MLRDIFTLISAIFACISAIKIHSIITHIHPLVNIFSKYSHISVTGEYLAYFYVKFFFKSLLKK